MEITLLKLYFFLEVLTLPRRGKTLLNIVYVIDSNLELDSNTIDKKNKIEYFNSNTLTYLESICV